MTAEIAILNAEAVSLAADSAISMQTERGPKVYQSANKIFALSRSLPVGLMVYDSAKFLSVPWETVAKTYREERGQQTFPTLAEHGEDFLRFLRNSRLLFPASARNTSALRVLYVLFRGMREVIDDRVEKKLEAQGTIGEAEIKAIITDLIVEIADYFRPAARLPSAPTNKTMSAALRPHIRDAREGAFEKLPLSAVDKRRLTEIAVAAFTKDTALPLRAPERSGVVIAGFGSEEIYPSVYDLVLEGLFRNTLKGVYRRSTTVEPLRYEAVIIPFAQREIVDAFLGGIEPEFQRFIRSIGPTPSRAWERSWSTSPGFLERPVMT